MGRWFYNAETNRCETFVYGGCAGNENNFETHAVCRKQCVKTTIGNTNTFGAAIGGQTRIAGVPPTICMLPHNTGLLRLFYSAYYNQFRLINHTIIKVQ